MSNGAAGHNYHPEIDGLRAIAVLSVFLHHINPSLVPGGFIGVDVFFVISGYLITGQIASQIRAGTFTIRQFYQRRINRIVPALTTVILASIAAGLVLLSPDDLTQLTRSAASSIFGFSNVFFWREYGNYFAANVDEAPLLHTWSLSVEEQFYIVWPLLLLCLLKWLNRYMISILFLLLLAALVVSEVGTRIMASASYYLLPTRFFELMIGGLLVLLASRRSQLIAPRNTGQSGLALIGGLLMILTALLWIDRETSFPGMFALLPCVGTVIIIWSGLRPVRAHGMLTNRIMAFIGLLSYSIYLWHWPIIVFLNYLYIKIDPLVGFGVFVATFLLSWMSWRFIETPFRRSGSGMSFQAVFIRRFAFPAIVLLVLAIATIRGQGFPARFDPMVARLEAVQSYKPNELRAGCHVPTALYDTPPLERCRLGLNDVKVDGILIGDSFANHFSGMLDVIAKHDGVAFMDYTMDGCPPIVGYDNGKSPVYAERCRLRNEVAYQYIEQKHFRYVVLASSWPTSSDVYFLLSSSIKRLLATGAQVVIILKNETIENASSCTIRNAMYGTDNDCKQQPRGQPEYIADIREQFPSVRFVDPNSVICGVLECDPMLDGVLIYRDSSHLNDLGARLIGEKLIENGFTLLGANLNY